MISNMKKSNIARLFHVLGVETRLGIVLLLKDHVLCVGAIAAKLGITQSAVSQHMRILKDAGLVVPYRQGYFIHYRLNHGAFAEIHKLAGDFMCDNKRNNKCRLYRKGLKICAVRMKSTRNAQAPKKIQKSARKVKSENVTEM